jgi:peroxiredoxin
MKLKFTTPVIMGFAAAGILAVSAGAALVIQGQTEAGNAASEADASSITVGRKHIESQNLPASQTQAVALNKAMPDLTLTDLQGKTHHLADWRGQPVLFVFADTVCPCVKSYRGRVQALHDQFAADGLQIVSIYPDAAETPAQIRRFIQQYGYPGVAVKDDDQKLLRLFNAHCTTETFLVDATGKLRYHGRIDDNIYKPEQVKVRDLQNALTEVVADRTVATPETQTYGCAFTLQQKTSKELQPSA